MIAERSVSIYPIAAEFGLKGTIGQLMLINNREDAYSHTGGIFIRDTARDTQGLR